MRIRLGNVVFTLIIASILNLVIAWLCVYYAVPSFQEAILLTADEFDKGAELVTERDHELAGTKWAAFGVTELDCHGPWIILLEDYDREANYLSPDGFGVFKMSFIFKNTKHYESIGQYSLRFQIHDMLYQYSKLHTRIDAGWPMLSLRGFASGGRLDPNNLQIVFPLQEVTVISKERQLNDIAIPRYLPYGPIWFGLIVNTLVYATVNIAIMWMLFTVRAKMRLRRNLCPHCKYPIGVSEVCTECGYLLPVEKIGCH